MAGRGAPQPPRLASAERMDPARKRKIRLVVALAAAVCLAAALLYTSFSASTEASKPSRAQAGAVLRGHRQGRERARSATGRRAALPRPRPRRHRVGAGHLHGRRAGPVPRRARGDRVGRARARHLRRPSATRSSRSARRSSPRTSSPADDGRRRVRLPGRRAADGRLRGRRVALRRAHGPARVGHLRPARDLLPRRPVRDRLRAARGRLPALGLLVRAGGRGLLDRHADLLQGHRAVGDPGRLAAAVGHAAVAVRERGAVPHAPLAARHRAVRHRGARRDRRLLPAADGGLGEPVRHARERRRPRARASTRCCATRR